MIAALHLLHIPVNLFAFCAGVLRQILHMFNSSDAVKHFLHMPSNLLPLCAGVSLQDLQSRLTLLNFESLSTRCNMCYTSPRTSMLVELQPFCRFCTRPLLPWLCPHANTQRARATRPFGRVEALVAHAVKRCVCLCRCAVALCAQLFGPLSITALCPSLSRTPEASSEDTVVMPTGTTAENVAGRF